MKLRSTRKAKTAATDLFKKVLTNQHGQDTSSKEADGRLVATSSSYSPRKEGSQSPRGSRRSSPHSSKQSASNASKTSTSTNMAIPRSPRRTGARQELEPTSHSPGSKSPARGEGTTKKEPRGVESKKGYSTIQQGKRETRSKIQTEGFVQKLQISRNTGKGEDNAVVDSKKENTTKVAKPQEPVAEKAEQIDQQSSYGTLQTEERNNDAKGERSDKCSSDARPKILSKEKNTSPKEKFTAIMDQLTKPVQFAGTGISDVVNLKEIPVITKLTQAPQVEVSPIKVSPVKEGAQSKLAISVVLKKLLIQPSGIQGTPVSETQTVPNSRTEVPFLVKQEAEGSLDCLELSSDVSESSTASCKLPHSTELAQHLLGTVDATSVNIKQLTDAEKQRNFFSVIGLVKKTEIPSIVKGHGQHRSVGGRLRRNLKPKLIPEMSHRGLAYKYLYDSDSDSDGRASPRATGGHKSRALIKMLSQKRSQSPRAGSCNSSPSSTPRKTLDPRKSLLASDSHTHSIKRKKEWLLPPSKKPKVLPESATLRSMLDPQKPNCDDLNTRRSARNKGGKRKEWWHLLRAAPDEYESPRDLEETEVKRRKKEEASTSSEKPKMSKDKSKQKCQIKVDIPNSKFKQMDDTVFKEPGQASVNDTNKNKSKKKKKKSKQKDVEFKSPKKPYSKALLDKASKLLPGLRPELATEILAQTVNLTGPEIMELDDETLLQKVNQSPGPGRVASPRCKQVGSPRKAMQAKINLSRKIESKEGESQFEDTDEDSLTIVSGFASQKEKNLQCMIPHMCDSCFTNDHSYCIETKTSKSVAFSHCLHKFTCVHYRNVKGLTHDDCRVKGFFGHSFILRYTLEPNKGLDSVESGDTATHLSISGNNVRTGFLQHSAPTCGADLICKEVLPLTDPPIEMVPEGTELLRIQLKARAKQLAESIGDTFKWSHTPNPTISDEKFVDNENVEEKPVLITEFAAEEIFGIPDKEEMVPLLGLKHDRDPRIVYHRDSLGRPRRRMPNTCKRTWDNAKLEMIIRQKEMSELAASVLSSEAQNKLASMQEQVEQIEQKVNPPPPQTSRLKIRIVPAAAAEANPELIKNDKSDQKVVKVKIQRVDSGKVIISKVDDSASGTELGSTSHGSCTVTHSPICENKLGKGHPNKVHIQGELFKNSDKILEQVIAREAARFVTQPNKDTQVVTVTLESEPIDATEAAKSTDTKRDTNVMNMGENLQANKRREEEKTTEADVKHKSEKSLAVEGKNVASSNEGEETKQNQKEDNAKSDEITQVQDGNALDVTDPDLLGSQESGYASMPGSQEITETEDDSVAISTSMTMSACVTTMPTTTNSQCTVTTTSTGQTVPSVIATSQLLPTLPVLPQVVSLPVQNLQAATGNPGNTWSVVGMITPKGLQPLTTGCINADHVSLIGNVTSTSTVTTSSSVTTSFSGIGPIASLTVGPNMNLINKEGQLIINAALQSAEGASTHVPVQHILPTIRPMGTSIRLGHTGQVTSQAMPTSQALLTPVYSQQTVLPLTSTLQPTVLQSVHTPGLSQATVLTSSGYTLLPTVNQSATNFQYSVTTDSSSSAVPTSLLPTAAATAPITLPQVNSALMSSVLSSFSAVLGSAGMSTGSQDVDLTTNLAARLAEPANPLRPSSSATVEPVPNLLSEVASNLARADAGFVGDSLEQQLADISDIIETEVSDAGKITVDTSPVIPSAIPSVMSEGSLTASVESSGNVSGETGKANLASQSFSGELLLSSDKNITSSDTKNIDEKNNIETQIPTNNMAPSTPFSFEGKDINMLPKEVEIMPGLGCSANILRKEASPVQPESAQALAMQPISVSSTQAALPRELQEQSTSLEDGSQVLTFTTKEIRERNPKLLKYMKNAGLVPVVKQKLAAEKVSILSLMTQAEQQMASLKSAQVYQEGQLDALVVERSNLDQKIDKIHRDIIGNDTILKDCKKELITLDVRKTSLQTRVTTCQTTLDKLMNHFKKKHNLL